MNTGNSYFSDRVRDPARTVVICKRLMDIAIGSFGSFIFITTYPLVALIIKLESPGAAIYSQERVGINRRSPRKKVSGAIEQERKLNIGGKPFTIYKFRSMRTDAELNGPQLSKNKGDARITRIGKWLRTLHIDELPQFWNVLKGDMSFIGPRPERPHFTVQYGKQISHYGDRTLYTKPGLTGLAQIILGYDETLDSIIRKSYFDLAYSASLTNFWSWSKMEAWIFFNTFFYLIKRPNKEGDIEGPESLSRIKRLPFKDGEQTDEITKNITGVLRFNSFERNIVIGGLSPDEITRKVEMLGNFGQKNVEVTLNPDATFDLEDLGFLVNLIHKVKEADGKLSIRNSHPQVQKMLKELHIDKIINLEMIRKTMVNFLTVDVECWFHAYNLKSHITKSDWHMQTTRVVNNVERILHLLKSHNCTATFFILGWVAKYYPEVVQMIDAEGHEIGTHGYYHNLITEMTPDEFEEDLEKSLNEISKNTSQKIYGHRGSNFTITKSTLWALKIMAKYGLEYDSSIFPIGRNRYGIPNYPNRLPHKIQFQDGVSIKEYPMATLALGKKLMPIGGGGYLRLYPYRVTDRYIEQMNLKGYPAMVYFHPWELDNAQKRIKVDLLKRFQHYVNIHTTDWKLSHLMERFQFSSIRNASENKRISRIIHSNPVKISMAKGKIGINSMPLRVEEKATA